MKQKIYAALLSASLVLGAVFSFPVSANDVGDTFKATIKTQASIFNGKSDQYKGKTVILHTNDVHGQIDGYAYVAALEQDFVDAGAEVITVDAGDFSQGDPNVSVSKGASAVSLMNESGYDYITLGNHEFDYGYSQLAKNLKSAKFKILCADVLKSGKSIYDANAIYTTKGGVKIGLFGLDTPEAASKANPSLIKGLKFLNNANGKSDLYDCGKEQVAALEKKKADVIIGITHLGMDKESSEDGHRSADLYKNVSGIDMLLDGHSHDVMTEGPAKEPIQSTGTKFDNIGVVVIDEATKKISDHYLVDTEGLEKDSAVEKKAQKVIDEINEIYGAKIGTSQVQFASEKTENRCYETNTGDLITDAMAWKVSTDKSLVKVSQDKVVALTNGGGIRAGINIGKVTKKDIQSVLPFGNTLCVAYITGSELLEILEASTFELPAPVGGYPQTKGIKFTIDTSKEYDKGDLYPDTTYYAPKSINRVSISSVNGKPFKKSATYALVTNDFIAVGGDTYYAVKASDSVTDTGIPVDEIVSDYIQDELDGILSAKRYGTSRGDVTIKPAPEETKYKVANPLGCKLKKLTSEGDTMTVKWSKTKDEVDGYQIACSTKKNMSDKTTKTFKAKAGKTTKKISGLSANKTYYVRVRTYVKVNGKTMYSSWSNKKKITIK